MIIEVIIKGICIVIKLLFTAIKSIFPMFSVPIQFGYCVTTILSVCTQANNFIYFIMGDTAFILIPSIILLIGFKYVAYPIFNFAIGIFSNKSSS